MEPEKTALEFLGFQRAVLSRSRDGFCYTANFCVSVGFLLVIIVVADLGLGNGLLLIIRSDLLNLIFGF